jgi:hypothetical protein
MKILSRSLLFFVFALFITWAHAQEKDSAGSQHVIALRFGMIQVKDENLHPKVSTGTLTELVYGFEKRKKTWQQFHLAFAYSRLKTTLEDLSKSVNLQLKLDYSKSYLLKENGHCAYFLGPETRLAYNACYFPNWDDSHLYWADYFSIGVRNHFTIKLKNQNALLASLSVPLFSVFSRPDLYRLYKIDKIDAGGIAQNLNSNISAAHLVNVFFISFDAEYRFPVFRNKREAFTYSFGWLLVKKDGGNAFNQVQHQIGMRIFL